MTLLEYINVEKITYVYDFGDNWVHEISFGKVVYNGPYKSDELYPTLVEAKGNVPIEDSGGIMDHNETVAIMQDPNHKDYKRMHEWYSEWYHGKYTPHADIFPDLELAVRKFAKKWNKKFSKNL